MSDPVNDPDARYHIASQLSETEATPEPTPEPEPEPPPDAPEAPPEVADQLVVLFQLPVPPVTQNRAAMLIPQQVCLQQALLRLALPQPAQEGS